MKAAEMEKGEERSKIRNGGKGKGVDKRHGDGRREKEMDEREKKRKESWSV